MQSSSKKCFYARYGCKRKRLMYILGITDKIKTEYEMTSSVRILNIRICKQLCLQKIMGFGTARGGRLPCKQEIQVGSIPTRSIKVPDVPYFATHSVNRCKNSNASFPLSGYKKWEKVTRRNKFYGKKSRMVQFVTDA